MLKIVGFLHSLIVSCMNNLNIMFSYIKIEKIQFIHVWVFWPRLDQPVPAPTGNQIADWALAGVPPAAVRLSEVAVPTSPFMLRVSEAR